MLSWADKCSGLARGDLRTAGTGTGLNNGEAAGDRIGFLVERDGGGGGGGRFRPGLKSELVKAFRWCTRESSLRGDSLVVLSWASCSNLLFKLLIEGG